MQYLPFELSSNHITWGSIETCCGLQLGYKTGREGYMSATASLHNCAHLRSQESVLIRTHYVASMIILASKMLAFVNYLIMDLPLIRPHLPFIFLEDPQFDRSDTTQDQDKATRYYQLSWARSAYSSATE
jgi:hypothetical protein